MLGGEVAQRDGDTQTALRFVGRTAGGLEPQTAIAVAGRGAEALCCVEADATEGSPDLVGESPVFALHRIDQGPSRGNGIDDNIEQLISDICLPALSRKIPANAFGTTARLRLALS